jgi:hypothetical protein
MAESKLPASPDLITDNLNAALATLGSSGGGGGGGSQFMRIDYETGAVTYGRDNTPVPLKYRWAAPIAGLMHGYKVWEGSRVVEQVMRSMITQPALPMPATPYVGFGQSGPRKCTELQLCALDEPGFTLIFSVLNVSNENEVRALVGEIVAHVSTTGMKHPNPVILIKPRNYQWNGKTIWCFGFEIVDWAANDGVSLMSKAPTQLEGPAEPAPWDEEAAD